ncbi:uncharacterized protein J7T54_006201 [Emericellopsis cladophorae]|uniref:GPI anchored protein n=1 Tax=Emericellopsis cladophorae TaxID=2686198 RepID=A0A9P9Y991_9HYPO|nr:uncharacterized protein J7T54_006201 [Emericellopsis cladophorae]KAI6785862.1 hypothetical protein J7T54_006201 [Emericellopsis cladophorae]
MRSALFATASLALTASASKIKRQGEFTLPVEPKTWTSDGVVHTGLPLGTFTETNTNTDVYVPSMPLETPTTMSEDTPIVTVTTPAETVTFTTPIGSSSGTTVTETDAATETESPTETDEDGNPVETDGGDDEDQPGAAALARPFAGALGAIAAVGIAMAL